VRAKSKVRGSELAEGDGGVVMKEVFAALQTFFSSSTGWAIIICAVGSAAGFLPWIEVSSSGLLYLFHPRLNAFALVRGGDPCWHGVGATGVFAVLGLVLIATFSTKPIHLWKTVAVLASGVGVIVEICLLLSWAYQPRPTTQTMSVAGKIVREEPIHIFCEPLGTVFVSLAGGIALLLLSALQIRALLFRGGTSPEPRPDQAPGR
jgi:hypothetical protein